MPVATVVGSAIEYLCLQYDYIVLFSCQEHFCNTRSFNGNLTDTSSYTVKE